MKTKMNRTARVVAMVLLGLSPIGCVPVWNVNEGLKDWSGTTRPPESDEYTSIAYATLQTTDGKVLKGFWRKNIKANQYERGNPPDLVIPCEKVSSVSPYEKLLMSEDAKRAFKDIFREMGSEANDDAKVEEKLRPYLTARQQEKLTKMKASKPSGTPLSEWFLHEVEVPPTP